MIKDFIMTKLLLLELQAVLLQEGWEEGDNLRTRCRCRARKHFKTLKSCRLIAFYKWSRVTLVPQISLGDIGVVSYKSELQAFS